ncbi:glycosyltransferase family 4 protein [Corynebacterium marambiense]
MLSRSIEDPESVVHVAIQQIYSRVTYTESPKYSWTRSVVSKKLTNFCDLLGSVGDKTVDLLPGLSRQAVEYWRIGDISNAICHSKGVQKKQYEEWYRFILFINDIIFLSRTSVRCPSNSRHRPLIFLVNSLPYSSSGYTHRSQKLLASMVELDIPVKAVTRLSYPCDIGYIRATVSTRVGSMVYEHLLGKIRPVRPLARCLVQAHSLQETAVGSSVSLIHATTPWHHGASSALVSAWLGLPFVYEMRGQIENTWLSRIPFGNRHNAAGSSWYQLSRRAEESLSRFASSVIVLSEVQKNDLVERGIAKDKIFVVPNGVDVFKRFRPSRDSSRTELGIGPSTCVFGTVSSIVKYEGLDLLVKMLSSLPPDGDFVVLIVGDGDDLKRIRSFATKQGLSERCIFTGAVDPVVADRYLQCLDVFCIPRVDCEVTRMVTPMKGFAALSYGIPVLVSDLPALREVVPSELNHWCLPTGRVEEWAKMVWYYRNGVKADETEAIAGFLADRTWRHSAETVLSAYDYAVNRSKDR